MTIVVRVAVVDGNPAADRPDAVDVPIPDLLPTGDVKQRILDAACELLGMKKQALL